MGIYKSIVVAQKFAVGTAARAAIDRSYRETQQVLAIAATAGLAPMLLIMFALKNVNLNKEQADEQSGVASRTASEGDAHGNEAVGEGNTQQWMGGRGM